MKLIDKENKNIYRFFFIAVTIIFSSLISIIILPKRFSDIYLISMVFLVLFFVLKAWKKIDMLIDKVPDFAFPVFFLVINTVIHTMWLWYLHDKITQVSDFGTILKVVETGDYSINTEGFRLGPHKLLYAILLIGLNLNSQGKIYIFQGILVTIGVVFLWFTGKRYFSKKVAMTCCFIYTFSPARIMYSAIVVEEHISIIVLLAFIFILLDLMGILKKQSLDRRDIIHILVCGFLLGLLSGFGVFFKDWSMIIIIATALGFLIFAPKLGWKKIIVVVVCFAIVIGARYILKTAIFSHCDNVLGIVTHKNAAPMYMYYTMMPTSNGAFNRELLVYSMEKYASEGYQYSVTDRELLRELWDQIKLYPEKMPSLFILKIRTAYSEVSTLGQWVYQSYSYGNKETLQSIYTTLMKIDNAGWISILIMTIITSIKNIKERNIYLFVLNIFLIGCVFLVFIIESQSRYKYSVMPIWYLFSSCYLLKSKEKNELYKKTEE